MFCYSLVDKNVLIGNLILSEQPYLIEELTSQNINWEPYHENIRVISNKINKNKIKKY